MTARSCSARAGVKRTYSICVCQTLAQKLPHASQQLGYVEFLGWKNLYQDLLLRVSDVVRICEFGINFSNVFYSFWHFTPVVEPVRMKINT